MYVSLCFLTAPAYKRYGVVYPHRQALEYNDIGKLTCHSATKPEWTYSTKNWPYKTFSGISMTNSTIPESVAMVVGNNLILLHNHLFFLQYFCEGTNLNGSRFLAQAFVYRASKLLTIVALT